MSSALALALCYTSYVLLHGYLLLHVVCYRTVRRYYRTGSTLLFNTIRLWGVLGAEDNLLAGWGCHPKVSHTVLYDCLLLTLRTCNMLYCMVAVLCGYDTGRGAIRRSLNTRAHPCAQVI